MTMENTFLKGTFLSSTENKFLLQNRSTDGQKYALIKILQEADENELTSTKNRLLKKYESTKTKRRMYLSMRRDLSRDSPSKRSYASNEFRKRKKKKKSAVFKEAPVQRFLAMPQTCAEDILEDAIDSFDCPKELEYVSNALALPDSLAPPVHAAAFGGTVLSADNIANFGSSNLSFGGAPRALGLKFGGVSGAAAFSASPMSRAAKISPGNVFLLERNITEMPSYSFDFGNDTVVQVEYNSFNLEIDDCNLVKVHQVKLKKMVLLNAVSMALMCSPNLKNPKAPFRTFIQKCSDDVRFFNPEFILKVALYARQELNIRSMSNFLLSYAAYHDNTHQYLEKYFEAAIVLPSDWLEVVDFYQTYNDNLENKLPLPASLRRVMKSTFKKFDEYQLAKYNKGKKKKSNIQVNFNEDTADEDVKIFHKSSTLKQMIRTLHIDSPAYEVMCLLGKKYPETPDAFKRSGLSGIWNSKLAGKRMKLSQPMTWETQISAKGNKPSVWEGLIDSNKLPYMAMLRNLRSLILSGISPKHHDKVLSYLQNKNAVINCRQVPLQFYEAYKVIDKLKEIKTSAKETEVTTEKGEVSVPWKKMQIEKISQKIQKISLSILDRYTDAINKALEISSLHNLQPIPGKTLIICDVLIHSPAQSKKIFDLCIMMGLMCCKACEYCSMYLICSDVCSQITFGKDEQFLKVLLDISSSYQHLRNYQKTETDISSISGLNTVLDFYLKQQTILSQKLDHIIFLRTSQAKKHYEIKDVVSSFLIKYRQTINPDLIYTDVDMTVNKDSFTDISSENPNDVYLHGNSPQLIKFIAERSSDGLLSSVENIDIKYNLKSKHDSSPIRSKSIQSSEEITFSPHSRIPKWKSVRIFISSTFKDMHSERDVLVRYVMPELRRRAACIFVKINEVDLRWGITEFDCTTKRASELCLIEAQKSDLFIGMLGERYGQVYDFTHPVSAELQWLKDYPQGLSITELEMHAGVLRKKQLAKKGFFYFRKNSFLSQVPEKWKEYFASESNEAKIKVEELKAKVRSSGAKIVEDYPCNFAGIFKGKPILSGLNFFAKAVLDDLWLSVNQLYEKENYCDTVREEEDSQLSLLSNFDIFLGERNSLAESFVKKFLKEYGIFLITGASGIGKTAFVINLLKKLSNFIIIKLFIGLTPKSTDLNYILQFIAESIERKLPVSVQFPKSPADIKNNFPDILLEASKCSNGNLVLLLDGLDHLQIEAQTLDWLPLVLPDNIRLIISASDSSPVFKMICDRQAYGNVVFIEKLPVLPQSDQETIIRHYLRLYGKSLGESSFNNQMIHLVTKKDSGIPHYLRLVCDYLRTYASFENFTTILQNIPTSMPLLLQDSIKQIENEYTSSLVQATFTLLCIAKEGLDDSDLHLLLSVISMNSKNDIYLSLEETIKRIKSLEKDKLLPQITYFSLVHMISTFSFGYIRSTNFNLIETEMGKAAKKFYFNKNSAVFERNMHLLLAAYYYTICDPELKEMWKSYSSSAVKGLLYHLFHGKCFKELSYLICNLEFLEVIFKLNAEDILIEYYTYLIEKSYQGSHEVKGIDLSALKSFKKFISRNIHILHNHPELTAQQALNEPHESAVKVNCTEKKKSSIFESLTQLNESDYRLSTLNGFMKPITALACHERKDIAALGSEDGYLKIFDFTSEKIIRNLKNHSSAITSICFGGKHRICTASKDGTLNIWSSEDFSLISTLKGHRRNVSGCCCDHSGCILISCSWDNSVRLWSLHDGRSISVIDDFRCPVNCIDHHPMKQQVACGLWNGNLEIWNTVSLKRILATSSQCGSIKSVAFSLDGISIVSSFINSEVAIWSAEVGLKLSSLTGHTLPVKSIAFSYENILIVSGGEDCTLKVWPTETGLPICTLSSCKYYPISMIEILSHDVITMCLQNSEIWVMNMYTDQIIVKFSLSPEIITCISKQNCNNLSFGKKSNQLWLESTVVLGTESGKILIGNFETSDTTQVGLGKSRITSITHNASFIVCGNSAGDVGVFAFPDWQSFFVCGAHPGSVTSLFLFEDYCCKALSTGYDKFVKSWNINVGNEGLEVEHDEDYTTLHKDSITSCHYVLTDGSEHSCKLITGSHDNTVILKEGHKELTLTGLKTSVITVSCMNKYIIGCGIDGSIAMWTYSGKLATYIPGIDQSSAVLSFYIKKDSDDIIDITLAFVDRNGTVKITKPIKKSYWYSLEGHSKSITSCCLNRNGEILSSSLDGTVNLWKVKIDVPDSFSNHKSSVTSILISLKDWVMISSDMLGNIIMWKIHQENSNCSIACIAKKSYACGFIKALAWLKEDTFISAVTQLEREETHFLDIVNFKKNEIDNQESYYFKVIKSHSFKSEILSMDACSVTSTIVVTFKSGEIMVISSNSMHRVDISEGWITNVKLWTTGDSIEYLFICPLNGQVKRFPVSDIITDAPYKKLVGEKYFDSTSLYTTTFCCENENVFFCGDSEGYLRTFKTNEPCRKKKVHLGSITGIAVVGSYIFTSSVDRTVKVFISCTLQQVGMFCSSAPITYLVVKEVFQSKELIIGIGTQSGSIELLKFHPIA